MKDKCFIYYGNPCSSCLSDPEVPDFEAAKQQRVVECPYATDRERCGPPRFGCVRVAGARMARAVIQFYTEASEDTLALDRDFFRRRAPLPPRAVQAYIDPDRGFEHVTDPEEVVQRVWENAHAVLQLHPGERIRRQVGRYAPPTGEVPAALRRDAADATAVKRGKPAPLGPATLRPGAPEAVPE